MNKPFAYFPLSIGIIIFGGAAFYFITAENPIFFSNGREPARTVLPLAGDNIAVDRGNEAKSPPKSGSGKSPVTSPKPTPSQPITEIKPLAPDEPEESVRKTHLVSMESDGFKPRVVVIKVGDTVQWANNDANLHWPASDPHPTHTGLAGFDPFADILPGESFSYTFTKPGAWGYHDHTLAVVGGVATITGIVLVEE